MRRAAMSIPCNMAEGYGRKTTAEYIRYLYIAYGSICELGTQVLLSGDFGYIKTDRISKLQCDRGEVERMLKALIKSLENKHLNP
jgi:four helix bundle protein